MATTYMTVKLNLPDGTIIYPQVSLDNIVKSIGDPTLVSVATTTGGKVPTTELPTVTSVRETASASDTVIPTEKAVAAAVAAAGGLSSVTIGSGLSYDQANNTLSVSGVPMASVTGLSNALLGKQATLVASTGVLITGGNTISVSEIPQSAVVNLANDLSVLSGRIDQIASLPEGSTSGDAELLDIRIGANGSTYSTAGDAVRGQSIDNVFESGAVWPDNLLDATQTGTGYWWTDGFHESSSYSNSGLVRVQAGQHIYYSRGNQTVAAGRGLQDLNFIVYYGADGTTVTGNTRDIAANDGVVVPAGAYYARFSGYYFTSDYSMLQLTSTLFDFVPYQAPVFYTRIKAANENDEHITKIALNAVKADAAGRAIFSAERASVNAGTSVPACTYCDNKKNEYIEYFANFSTLSQFPAVFITHGKDSYGGGYIRFYPTTEESVQVTKIEVYSYNGTLIETYTLSNLPWSGFIYARIYTKNDSSVRSTITFMTASGEGTVETSRFYSCRGAVNAYANFDTTNLSIRYVVNDAKEDVWVFGDSYISLGDPNRWATRLINGSHKNVLLCGFPGAQSANEILAFRELIAVSKPKFVVWCLGMNDGDSNGAVNASWKTCVDEVIATCEAKGVVPILTTTPNVPNIDHTYKNAYVLSTGCRYVDFAKAVNAEAAAATWYTGMLSQDNTHPTALGATALLNRFLLDVPEVLYAEE